MTRSGHKAEIRVHPVVRAPGLAGLQGNIQPGAETMGALFPEISPI